MTEPSAMTEAQKRWEALQGTRTPANYGHVATEADALAEAQKRWGADAPKDGQPARSYGHVIDDKTTFGRRFKVGRWFRDTTSVGHFEPEGEGSSWAGAFEAADRRTGHSPRR